MRDAFIAQPICRFIHDFFLHDTIMKLWVFDWFDLYNLGEFDIHEKLEKFIEAIVRYVMMDDEELGLNTFIKLDDTSGFITISRNVIEKKNRM